MVRPLVSVVMPVYNAENYLREAIESILNQSFTDFEFLIFDDGSEDRSREIITHYAKSDKRIVPFYSDVNKGYVDYLNQGIVLSKAKFVARMDSDDISLKDRLLKQFNFLSRNEDIAAVGSSVIRIDLESKELGFSKRHTDPETLWWQSFFTNPLAHPTVMIRKAFLTDERPYHVEKAPSEDYHLWCKMLRHHHPIANIAEPLLKYREHPGSISAKKKTLQRSNSISTLKDHWKYFTEFEISDQEAVFFRLFHQGYEGLPADKIENAFTSLRRLFLKFQRRQKMNLIVENDAFSKLFYLALASRKLSYKKAMKLNLIVFRMFPAIFLKRLLKP